MIVREWVSWLLSGSRTLPFYYDYCCCTVYCAYFIVTPPPPNNQPIQGELHQSLHEEICFPHGILSKELTASQYYYVGGDQGSNKF